MPPIPEIEAYAALIARTCKPERIILFGSHAYGEPTLDSDVDILVVLRFEGKPWRKASEIRRNAPADFPLDLIVRTPEQLAERIAAGDPFFNEVAAKGRVLYVA
jgi:predicted nucleotidyltransferase